MSCMTRTHADIVKEIGPANIAQRRGLSIHTVRSWIVRDSIPSEHWAAFAADGWASLEELALGRCPEGRSMTPHSTSRAGSSPTGAHLAGEASEPVSPASFSNRRVGA